MVFRDRDDFEQTFVGFLKDLAVDDKTGVVANTGLLTVVRVSDLGMDIVIDSRVEPRPGAAYDVYTTPRFEGQATCIYEMSSDTLDGLYRGTLAPVVALTLGYARFRGAHVETTIKLRNSLDNAIPLYRRWRETRYK